MAVPFGFSISDFIACIGIIRDGISAFSDARGARNDYELLKATLDSLEQSFEDIRQISLDPQRDFNQHATVTPAVDRCWKCIDSFLQ